MSDGRRGKRGFTLIELLVVISVIVLLIALLLPVLSRTREVSRRTICASNFHQIGIGMMVYADTNNAKLFAHRNSIASPNYFAYGPTGNSYADGNEYDPNAYIPPERRESNASANTQLPGAPNYGQSVWDQLGGPKGDGGFFDGLFPHVVTDPRAFNCASIFNYAWSDMGYYAGWEWALRFETGMAPYYTGQAGYGSFFAPYAGNVFGRVDRPHKKYGHGFWSSYYVQGYYPYAEEYRSSYGALLWEIGSRGFWLGATGTVTMGNHYDGGSELFIDGSVTWKKYPWIVGN